MLKNDRSKLHRTHGFRLEEADLLLEFLCWFAALVLLPVAMGFRGSTAGSFLIYSCGAAALLTFGTFLGRSFAATGWRDYRDVAIAAFLAIFSIGGAALLSARLLKQLLGLSPGGTDTIFP
ncbi:MAG TPA: hypothetical protein VGD10_09375 [Allosphingosinicella sp.]|uniref:hypothetical protein n=1 Tax=Allosphingosinicella sp. TaxID=2823234 RepID=UPI002ED81273